MERDRQYRLRTEALTTTIVDEKVPDAVGTSLKLSVSAPTGKAMEPGETSPKTEFTVVLENTTSRALSDAVLTYEDGMTVMDAAGGTVDPVNHTITFSTLLANEKKTVTISKADPNPGSASTVTISGTFLASAKDGNQSNSRSKGNSIYVGVYDSKTKVSQCRRRRYRGEIQVYPWKCWHRRWFIVRMVLLK